MDKIEALYNSYIESGLLSKQTTLDQFINADDTIKESLYESGVSNKILSSKTDIDMFKSAWGETTVEEIPVEEKKNPDVTELPSEDGTSDLQDTKSVEEPPIGALVHNSGLNFKYEGNGKWKEYNRGEAGKTLEPTGNIFEDKEDYYKKIYSKEKGKWVGLEPTEAESKTYTFDGKQVTAEYLESMGIPVPQNEEEVGKGELEPNEVSIAFGQGVSRLGSGFMAIPKQIGQSSFSMAMSLAKMFFGEEAEKLDEKIQAMPEKERTKFIIDMLPMEAARKLMQGSADSERAMIDAREEVEATRKQYDANIIDDIGNGEFAQAGKRMFVGFAESVPMMALMLGTGGAGIAAVGVSTAADKSTSLQREGEDVDTKTQSVAALRGVSEVVGGKILQGIFKPAAGIARKAAKSIAKEFISLTAKNMGKEFLEESSQALQETLTDALAFGRDVDWNKLWRDAVDGGLIGAFSTSTSGASAIAQRAIKNNIDGKGRVELNIPAVETKEELLSQISSINGNTEMDADTKEGLLQEVYLKIANLETTDNQEVTTPEDGAETTEQGNIPNTETTEPVSTEIPNAEPLAQDIGADEVAANGFGMTSKPTRDSSLGEGGAVGFSGINKFRKKFKRTMRQTFSSEQGLDQEVVRAVEKHQGRIGLLSKVLQVDQRAFGKIIKATKKSLGKSNLKTGLKSINEYLTGDNTQDLSFLPVEQKAALDSMRDKLDDKSKQLVGRLKEQRARLMSEMEAEMTAIEKIQAAQVANDNPLGLDFGVEYEYRSKNMTGINNKTLAVDNLIATIEGNIGKYMFRSYDAFSDPDYIDDITSTTPTKEGKRRVDNATEFVMNELGISRSEAKTQVLTYLESLRSKEDYLSARMDGKMDAPFLKKRKDIPQPIRELLGESKDPVKNYIASSHNIGQYLSSIQYQLELSKFLVKSGIAKSKMQEGHTLFKTNNQGWDFLEETYVPVEFAEAMEDFKGLDPLNGGWSQAMVSLAGWSKLGKTVLSPTTAFRNLWSGSFLSLAAGFNPFDFKMFEGIQQSWGGKSTTKGRLAIENARLMELGILGDGAVSGEILQIMNDMNIDSSDLTNKSFQQKAMEFMQKFYAMGDDAYKVVGFYAYTESYQKAGMTLEQAQEAAAQRIRNGFPTYSKLPINIQKLRRFPLVGTFPSFAYEVWRTNRNNLNYIRKDWASAREATDPAIKKQYNKMAMQQIAGMTVASTAAFGLSMLSKMLYDISDEEEETAKNMAPEWQQDMMPIFHSKGDGNVGYVDSSAFFPQEVILKPLRILMQDREGREADEKFTLALKEAGNAFIGTDILVGTLADLHSNKSSYGQEIYKADNLLGGIFSEDFPKIMDYFLANAGYGYYNNIKEFARANADEEWMPSWAVDYFGEKSSKYKEYTDEEAILGFFGFRLSTVDFAQGMSNLALNAREDFIRKRSEALRAVKAPRTRSDADIQSIIESEDAFNKEVHKQPLLAVSGAYSAKIPQTRLEQVLKSKKFSNKSIAALLVGVEPPLKQIRKTDLKGYLTELEVGRLRTDSGKEYADLTKEEKEKFDKRTKISQSMIDNTLEFNKQTAEVNMKNMAAYLVNQFGDKLLTKEGIKTLTKEEVNIINIIKSQNMLSEKANEEYGEQETTKATALEYYKKLLKDK